MSTELSEAFGGNWPDAPSPVWQRLANAAKQYPDKLALACLHQSPDLYGFLTSDYTAGTKAELNPRTLANAVETRHLLTVADVAAVIVESPESATVFDSIYSAGERKLIKVVAGEKQVEGWTTIADLLEIGRKADTKDSTVARPDSAMGSEASSESESEPSRTVTILYTSGTTSLPKGCPHTDLTLNAFMKNLSLGGVSSDDIFCAFLPNNHAMGYFYVLHYFCNGSAVVYPSAAYDPAATAEALTVHNCTRTVHVSTALHSLIEWIEPQNIKFPSLIDVCLAGSSITPQMMRSVVHKLGSRGVSIGFGMTEGTKSLPRGEPGEIHQSGPGIIASYIGKSVGSESFYIEDGRTWFKSGDRGVMWADGGVSIVGRYANFPISVTLQMSLHELDTKSYQIQRHDHPRRRKYRARRHRGSAQPIPWRRRKYT